MVDVHSDQKLFFIDVVQTVMSVPLGLRPPRLVELRPAEHGVMDPPAVRPPDSSVGDTREQTPREAILAEVRASGSISTKLCVQRLGISSATAKRHNAELVTDGILEKKGSGPSTSYRLIK